MIDKVYLNPNTGMLTSEPTSGDDIKFTRESSWKPTQEQVKMLRALLDYNIGVFDYKGWNIVDELCKQLENM